ncbi:uncharacterized protein LOC123874057 [Maniola jurtina]|uniref:uncharacterized protein LOC123874057 n=1 Tax=Maniola jurtina TaxID=191418 RepID=UPI001E68A383|nr:uncharacterized protein LOC123874057 [Maniola jurtina]
MGVDSTVCMCVAKRVWHNGRSMCTRHPGGKSGNACDGVRCGTSWIYWLITIVTGACYLYVYVFSVMWLVFVRYSVAEDFVAIAVAISLGTGSFTCIIKLLFMKLHISHIRETIQKILTFDARIEPGTRFAINLRKNLRVIKKRALAVWIFLITDCVLYIFTPCLRTGRHMPEDLIILYGLEPMLESPNYEIALIVNIMCVGFLVYVMVNVAVYLIVIVGYNEAQLYTISEELKFLWDDSQNFYNEIKHRINNKIHAIDLKRKIENDYTQKPYTALQSSVQH